MIAVVVVMVVVVGIATHLGRGNGLPSQKMFPCLFRDR